VQRGGDGEAVDDIANGTDELMEYIMKIQTRYHSEAIKFPPATSTQGLSFRNPTLATPITLFAAILLLAISMCAGKNAHAQTSATAGQKTVLIPLSLATSLDSKKRKPGEEVLVKVAANVTLPGGSVISRGTKVVGHVTEAKARSGGDSESSMTIAFDKINTQDGKTLAISGVMQAVGPNPNESSTGGGVNYAGLNQTVQHTTAGSSESPVSLLNQDSVGVHGIDHLALGPDGVLRSDGKQVKLESGAQILLRAQVTAGS
jgi:hypothetical protein